jgi:thiamine-monophosphate kinase
VPLTEKALIARIRAQVRAGKNIVAGIGDDCAILRIPKGHEALVTTDFSLEGIHFRREWHPPEAVGHRCLARGLSDIAAMGGIPVAAFLSLAIPRSLPQSWVDRFTRGFLTLARRYNVSLAGGDTAESPGGVLADIVIVGAAPRGKAIRRSGAKPGDDIYVTGTLGGGAAALAQMMKAHRRLKPREFPRHFFPEPRFKVGGVLRAKGMASAMTDTSDGLSTDLAHICEESGVGAEVELRMLPRAVIGNPLAEVDLSYALHGGEDYELLFTASAGKRIPKSIAGVAVTRIGQIIRGKRIFQRDESGARKELRPRGWEHFRK